MSFKIVDGAAYFGRNPQPGAAFAEKRHSVRQQLDRAQELGDGSMLTLQFVYGAEDVILLVHS
jgi:hypothetical protein